MEGGNVEVVEVPLPLSKRVPFGGAATLQPDIGEGRQTRAPVQLEGERDGTPITFTTRELLPRDTR